MKSFAQFLVETLNCKDLSSKIKFSGTLEENNEVLSLLSKLIHSDCDTLIDLYCCIEEHIKPNFNKMGNMTRIRDSDKKHISKILNNLRNLIIDELAIKNCSIPNCTKRI